MSNLQKVLDNILNDKGVNLTPENLKQGITCLGILGDLEEKIKVFASEEDLFNSSDNQINDLAAVLTQEFTDSPKELFNVVNFPYVNGLWENPYYEGFYSKWLITNGEVEIGYIILTETTTEIDINYGKHFHVEYTKTSSSSREDGTEDGGMWDRTKFVLIENDIETDISGVEEYENGIIFETPIIYYHIEGEYVDWLPGAFIFHYKTTFKNLYIYGIRNQWEILKGKSDIVRVQYPYEIWDAEAEVGDIYVAYLDEVPVKHPNMTMNYDKLAFVNYVWLDETVDSDYTGMVAIYGLGSWEELGTASVNDSKVIFDFYATTPPESEYDWSSVVKNPDRHIHIEYEKSEDQPKVWLRSIYTETNESTGEVINLNETLGDEHLDVGLITFPNTDEFDTFKIVNQFMFTEDASFEGAYILKDDYSWEQVGFNNAFIEHSKEGVYANLDRHNQGVVCAVAGHNDVVMFSSLEIVDLPLHIVKGNEIYVDVSGQSIDLKVQSESGNDFYRIVKLADNDNEITIEAKSSLLNKEVSIKYVRNEDLGAWVAEDSIEEFEFSEDLIQPEYFDGIEIWANFITFLDKMFYGVYDISTGTPVQMDSGIAKVKYLRQLRRYYGANFGSLAYVENPDNNVDDGLYEYNPEIEQWNKVITGTPTYASLEELNAVVGNIGDTAIVMNEDIYDGTYKYTETGWVELFSSRRYEGTVTPEEYTTAKTTASNILGE